jgi:hypothetical protein
MLPNNYIVRIYRFEEENPKGLVGIVEEAGVDGNRAFRDLEELWEILSAEEKGAIDR